MTDIAPGWYNDPADPSTQRYWDGDGWVGARLPADVTPPDGPPPPEPAPEPAPPPAAPPVPTSVAPRTGAEPPMRGTDPFPTAQPYGAGQPVPFVHGLPLASYGSRLVARIIDIVAVFLLSAAVNGYFVYQMYLEFAPLMRAYMADPANTVAQPTARFQWLQLTVLLITTALWAAYEVPAMSSRGQTLGKRILNIRVVRIESTDPLGGARAFGRWFRLGGWTPFWGCVGFGLLMQLIGVGAALFDKPLRRAWHDRLAGTVVVQLPLGGTLPGDEQHLDARNDLTGGSS